MNFLLIDIGNSRIKCSLSINGKMSRFKSVLYNKRDFIKHFRSVLNYYQNKFTGIYISSLDKKYNSSIKGIRLKCNITFISADSILPLKIDYEKTLGSDRICSAVGAFMKYGNHKNILVIDSGTAVTFNLISAGIYKGGMISAGLNTASDALLFKTTLPKIVLNRNISIINKSTKSSIISGLILQHVLFIEKAVELYRIMFKKLLVIMTGGGAEIIPNKIKGVDKIELTLVLEGLNYIALHNQKIK